MNVWSFSSDFAELFSDTMSRRLEIAEMISLGALALLKKIGYIRNEIRASIAMTVHTF